MRKDPQADQGPVTCQVSRNSSKQGRRNLISRGVGGFAGRALVTSDQLTGDMVWTYNNSLQSVLNRSTGTRML